MKRLLRRLVFNRDGFRIDGIRHRLGVICQVLRHRVEALPVCWRALRSSEKGFQMARQEAAYMVLFRC